MIQDQDQDCGEDYFKKNFKNINNITRGKQGSTGKIQYSVTLQEPLTFFTVKKQSFKGYKIKNDKKTLITETDFINRLNNVIATNPEYQDAKGVDNKG